jgi:hypothetical protein
MKNKICLLLIALFFSGCTSDTRPTFSYTKPDTEDNQRIFNDFLKVELTQDIKNIYCFDDELGIDADYQISFTCSPATAQTIIKRNNLRRDSTTTDFGFAMQNEFKWWNKEKIATLELYSWTNGSDYHKYFWYDTSQQKAYFFDFDM